jgi:hypothetical protein
MPSTSYQEWATTRRMALDEIARAHAAVEGSRPGRRYATQQINRAYAVLLASHFQGFCRDLHSECIDHVADSIPRAELRPVMRVEFTWNRQLDRGNAHSGSIGADFGRLGVEFWDEIDGHHAKNRGRRRSIDELNAWRNAIVHQSFDPAKFPVTNLDLGRVRRWRMACDRLTRSFDEVMKRHLQALTGRPPW